MADQVKRMSIVTRRVIVIVTVCVVVSGLGGLLVIFDRFENVPAWTAQPERISARRGANGLMTSNFADALFLSATTSDDGRVLSLVFEGRDTSADRAQLRRFQRRYVAKAGALGFSRIEAERQFIWSAGGVCRCDTDPAVQPQKRLSAALSDPDP